MARWEFKLPDIGEGIAEGEIVAWLVKPGDAVAEDQPIVEVMTDKATVTITAPKAGVVVETCGRIGEIVAVHGVLVVFELDASAGVQPAHASHPRAVTADVNGAKRVRWRRQRGADDGPRPRRSERSPRASPRDDEGGPRLLQRQALATPATRKLARELDLDLRHIAPSGPDGRVTKADVEGFTRPALVEVARRPRRRRRPRTWLDSKSACRWSGCGGRSRRR